MNFIFNDMEFNRPGYLFKYIPENKTILIYNDILLYYDIVCYDEVQNIKNKKQLGIYVPIDQFDIFIDTLCQFGVEVLNDIHSDTTEKFSNDFFDFELKYRCPYGLAITSKYLQTARFSQIAGNSKYEDLNFVLHFSQINVFMQDLQNFRDSIENQIKNNFQSAKYNNN